jgi:hypothetical protein
MACLDAHLYEIEYSYVDELQEAMHTIHDLTRTHILVASDRMKTRYDLKANTAGFRVAV